MVRSVGWHNDRDRHLIIERIGTRNISLLFGPQAVGLLDEQGSRPIGQFIEEAFNGRRLSRHSAARLPMACSRDTAGPPELSIVRKISAITDAGTGLRGRQLRQSIQPPELAAVRHQVSGR